MAWGDPNGYADGGGGFGGGGGYGGGGYGSYVSGGGYGGGAATLGPMPPLPRSPGATTHVSGNGGALTTVPLSQLGGAFAFDGLDATDPAAMGGGAGGADAQLRLLRERLGRATAELQREAEARHARERQQRDAAKRWHEQLRDRQHENDRLQLELEQLREREEARKKVNLLEDEVRTFKSSSAAKLLQIESEQLREREQYHKSRLGELEEECGRLRQAADKRVGEVEAQRSKEVELHEKRIVKLMNVIEALTVPGDSKLDLRLLAEKMGRLREVRELLEEERALAAVYIKTTRDGRERAQEAERAAYKRQIDELQAEAKLLKSFAATQIDEAAQTHEHEIEAVRRRLREADEEKQAIKRSYEVRLGEMKAKRMTEGHSRDRNHLEREDELAAKLEAARRQAAEAEAALHERTLLLAAGQQHASAAAAHWGAQHFEAHISALTDALGADVTPGAPAEERGRQLEGEARRLRERLEEMGVARRAGGTAAGARAGVREKLAAKLLFSADARTLHWCLSGWRAVARREVLGRLNHRLQRGQQSEGAWVAERAQMETRLNEQGAALEAQAQRLQTAAELQAAAVKRCQSLERALLEKNETLASKHTQVRDGAAAAPAFPPALARALPPAHPAPPKPRIMHRPGSLYTPAVGD